MRRIGLVQLLKQQYKDLDNYSFDAILIIQKSSVFNLQNYIGALSNKPSSCRSDVGYSWENQ